MIPVWKLGAARPAYLAATLLLVASEELELEPPELELDPEPFDLELLDLESLELESLDPVSLELELDSDSPAPAPAPFFDDDSFASFELEDSWAGVRLSVR